IRGSCQTASGPARASGGSISEPCPRRTWLPGAEPVKSLQRLCHALDPDTAVVHGRTLIFRAARTVVDLGHDGRIRAVRSEFEDPPVSPAGLRRTLRSGVRVPAPRFRLPADAPVQLVL